MLGIAAAAGGQNAPNYTTVILRNNMFASVRCSYGVMFLVSCLAPRPTMQEIAKISRSLNVGLSAIKKISFLRHN